MLPRKLEHWLTEEGGKVVEKAAALGGASLTSDERLLREVWLFDTQIRNGGVSQYFGNWGNEQWATLCKGARPTLPSFSEFAGMVDKIVVGQEDPYLSVIGAGDTLDRAYYAVQTRLVTELRAYLRGRRRQV